MSIRSRGTPGTRALAAAGAMALAVSAAGLLTPRDVAAQAGEGQVGPAIGTQAPDAEVQDLDENPVSLLAYVEGKPTLIEFWATWCELCAALQPQLDEIHATYGDRMNIVAVAVAVSQSLRRVRRAVEEGEHGYPFVWDARGAAVRAYAAPTTSVIVIVDAEGKVAYTGVGAEQDLIGAVEGLLSGS